MLRTIAIAVVVAPLAAAAQVEVSRATITGTPVVRNDVLHVCAERNDRLWDRSALLDRDKQDIDREGREIGRLKAQLDEEKRRLDSTNAAAVADYNARSATLNARVAAHNRQVQDLNGAVALLNADSSQLTAYCNRIVVGSR
jgi:chromosome segregation ATPase